MENIYIIGDVHGCYKTLLALISLLPNKEKSKICFVGDLIDRGKDSYKVVEFVKNNNYDCVLGNHEKMALEYLPFLKKDKKNDLLTNWLFCAGGEETIKSYQIEEDIFEHLNYFRTLPLYLEYHDYKTTDNRKLVVSHSSIGKVWSLKNSGNSKDKEKFENHLLYSRYKNFDNEDIFNVYGHTIAPNPLINDYSASIDLGCYKEGGFITPKLCALEFPSMRVFIQENIE